MTARAGVSASWRYGLLSAGAVVMMAPLIWMVLASSKTLPEILKVPPTLLPEALRLDNYRTVLGDTQFVRYFFNSVIVAAITIASVLITSSMAGYAFAKFEFPGRNVIFALVLATLMIPFQVRVIPLYVLANDLHLLDTYAGLVLPGLVDAFGIFLMRQYLQSIPSELLDAGARRRCLGAHDLRADRAAPGEAGAVGVGDLRARRQLGIVPLAAPRDLVPGQVHAAARTRPVRRSLRDTRRSADGGGDAHHPAAAHRVPLHAAAVHRGHGDGRTEMTGHS